VAQNAHKKTRQGGPRAIGVAPALSHYGVGKPKAAYNQPIKDAISYWPLGELLKLPVSHIRRTTPTSRQISTHR